MTIRSIDALGAVTGSIGVSGGGISQGFEEYQPYDWSVWGDELRPSRRKILMQLLGKELNKAEPPVELIFVTAGNPLAMLPDSSKVAEEFAKIPFKVVSGHFMDDTAQSADLILPATTFLEECDIVAGYGHSFIGPVNQAIEPLGEAKSDYDLFRELAEFFDFKDQYLKTKRQWLEIIMNPTLKMGVSLEEIFNQGAYQRDIPHIPYLDKTFPTPSGKFHLIGSFEPPADHGKHFRYQLLSTAPKQWLCSEINPSEHPQSPSQSPLVTINADEAQSCGLAEGEPVEVYNHLGVLKARVKLSKDLRTDLVVIPRGGWGPANVNVLTQALVTEVGQGTAYYETRVNIRKGR
jgi:anaerobic selenocysteine-containing dehydrogenase